MILKRQLLCIVTIFVSLFFIQAQEVWVSDAGGFNNPPWFIYKFDENGENPITFLDQNDGIIWPEDILFLESQNTVLISNLSTEGLITKHNINTGAFIGNFASLGGPTRMKIGPDNLIYVLQWNGNGKVFRYEQDGTFVDEFTSVGVPQSIGLDWDSSGNLYVSSYSGSFIRQFDTNGNDLGIFINTNLSGPTNIWFDNNGNLIVLNWNNGIVNRFDSSGNFIENEITGIIQCEGVDFYPNGDMLIGVGSDDTVKKYDSDFNFLENFIEAGTLLTPNAIAIRNTTISVDDYTLENNILKSTVGDEFYITDLAKDKLETIKIYTVLGELLDNFKVSEILKIDAKHYSEGIYFVTSEYNNIKIVQKIIVKHH